MDGPKLARGLVDTTRAWLHGSSRQNSGPRTAAPVPNLVTVQARVPLRPSCSKGPTPMMYDLNLTAALGVTALMVLGAVYVWSADPDRRARAWRLLRLLLRR